MLWMIVIVVGIIFFFVYKSEKFTTSLPQAQPLKPARNVYTPEPLQGVIYQKPHFTLSYVEQYEIPEWVSYELTVDMLNAEKFPRDQEFDPDPAITTGSGHYRDYKGSGYSRGHLVPAGDMSWNKQAMDATFLISNIAPMTFNFNNGVWNELEQNVRDWARLHKRVLVISGPVFKDPLSVIGQNEILVPRYYYKAVFTDDEQQPRVIGFLLDQTKEEYDRLDQYVVSLDSIEKVTGIDLFSNLYGNWDKEIELEKQRSVLRDWPFNERWYTQRKRVESEE